MLLLQLLFTTFSWAYVPPAKMILQRVSDNSGSGVYQLEQELLFATTGDPILIRETWITDGKFLRVIATGQNELKDKFKFQAIYANGQKWTLNRNQKENQKIPLEMTERPFHQRTLEALSQLFIEMELLPENFLKIKPYSKNKEGHFDYSAEPFLRLSRTGGVVCYTLGSLASDSPAKNSSGVWIEQDQFHIRKIRWPSQSEMTIDESGSYSRGLMFPKTRTFRWGNQSVQMRTLAVQGKTTLPQPFQVSNLANQVDSIDVPSSREMLNDFYQRFR